jgi:hypothetical protein
MLKRFALIGAGFAAFMFLAAPAMARHGGPEPVHHHRGRGDNTPAPTPVPGSTKDKNDDHVNRGKDGANDKNDDHGNDGTNHH